MRIGWLLCRSRQLMPLFIFIPYRMLRLTHTCGCTGNVMNNGQCASLDPWPSSNLLRDLVKAAGRAQIGHYSLVDKVIVSGTPRDSANLSLSDLVPSSAPLPRPAGIWSPICLFARRTSFRHGSLEMSINSILFSILNPRPWTERRESQWRTVGRRQPAKAL